MFVAIVSYLSVGGYNKVSFVASSKNGRRVAFDTLDEAENAAQSAVDNGQISGQGLKKNGYTISVVDLEAGDVYQSGTAVEPEPETPATPATPSYVVA